MEVYEFAVQQNSLLHPNLSRSPYSTVSQLKINGQRLCQSPMSMTNVIDGVTQQMG
jgi:hypothetical protein